MTDDDALLGYDPQPAPTTPTVGSTMSVQFTVTNGTAGPVICKSIWIDLNPGDGPDNLATDQALGLASTQNPTDINAKFNNLKRKRADDKTKKHYFILTPNGYENFTFAPKQTFSLQIDNIQVNNALDAPGTLTTAQCRIIEESGPTDRTLTDRIHHFTIAKYPAGTAFRNFTTDPPDRVVTKRGDDLRLEWTAKPPPPFKKFKKGAKPPYYTLELYYDQLAQHPEATNKDGRLDVTAHNSDNGAGSFTGIGPDLLTLSHTTTFTLYLDLFDTKGRQVTHSMTTLAVVSPTDVTLTDFTLDRTAGILTTTNPVTQEDTATATTDGMLLCTVQASRNGYHSGLDITLTPPGERAVTYTIITDDTGQSDNLYVFRGPRIFLPVTKGTTVELVHTPSNGTYRAIWYPLGTGPLLGSLPPEPAVTTQ